MSNVILEHWQKPFHRERRPEADFHGRSISPACGDEIDLYLFVGGGAIRDAFFDGEGCTVCLGMASMTTKHLVGMPVDAARRLTEADVLRLASDVDVDRRRHGCALVALRALQDAL